MSEPIVERRVLLIDSEERWRSFGSLALTNAGYSVSSVDSVSDAHALLNGTGYDLILINILQAEHNRIAVKKITMTERESRMRIVVVSPISLSPTAIRNMFKVGADDCVAKQYNASGLLRLVDEQFRTLDSSDSKEKESERRKSRNG